MRLQLIGIITTAVVLLGWGLCVSTRHTQNVGSAVLVLDRAHGVREGTRVTYLGVDFGVIDQLTLADGRVVATLRIEQEGATLRTGDRIQVENLGLFGDKVLDVVPGPRTAPVLGPTDTLFTVQPPEVRPADLLDAWSRRRDRGGTKADTSSP